MITERGRLLRLSFPLTFPLRYPLTLGLALTFMRGWSTPMKMKDLAVAFTIKITLGLTLGLTVAPAVAAEAEKVLTFGIYAYRPPEIITQRFAPLASYLGERLPGTRVEGRAEGDVLGRSRSGGADASG